MNDSSIAEAQFRQLEVYRGRFEIYDRCHKGKYSVHNPKETPMTMYPKKFAQVALGLATLALSLFLIPSTTHGQTVELLHSFRAPGANPEAGLVQGLDGNFYGTTTGGGADEGSGGGGGTIFKITPTGAFTTLFTFPTNVIVLDSGVNFIDYPLGRHPNGLALGDDGAFYGTTQDGTNGNGQPLFKITTNGTFTVLYLFGTGPVNNRNIPIYGSSPNARLTRGNDGSFYGTTVDGGEYGLGTVFKVTPNGVISNVYSFGGVTNSEGVPLEGIRPEAAVVQAADGSIYGTATGKPYWRQLYSTRP